MALLNCPAISCNVLYINLCWHCEIAPDIFLALFIFTNLQNQSVSNLCLLYILSNPCVCLLVFFVCVYVREKEALSFIHTCIVPLLIAESLQQSSASVFLFRFLFPFNVVLLPFISTASGACLGKISCVTPPTPQSILQPFDSAQHSRAAHTHSLTHTCIHTLNSTADLQQHG